MQFRTCVKNFCIRSYSGPYFPAFGMNTEKYCVSLPIQSEFWKIGIRITPNMDTLYAVKTFKTFGLSCINAVNFKIHLSAIRYLH